MFYKAAEVILFFSVRRGGTGRSGMGIKGILRGPRGPKNQGWVITDHSAVEFLKVFTTSDQLVLGAAVAWVGRWQNKSLCPHPSSHSFTVAHIAHNADIADIADIDHIADIPDIAYNAEIL